MQVACVTAATNAKTILSSIFINVRINSVACNIMINEKILLYSETCL